MRLRGTRHREVLARLLVARGHVVPVDRLIDDLWPQQPPQQALAVVQTFVSQLRRALEPDRAPRAPGRILVTEPPGYALRVSTDSVDAWRLERLVHDTGELLDAGRAPDVIAELEAHAGEHPLRSDRCPASRGELGGRAEMAIASRGRIRRWGRHFSVAVTDASRAGSPVQHLT
ncbi:MAG: AfsR/SARP family transcriptional regulator [Pseudonocardia sp.]